MTNAAVLGSGKVVGMHAECNHSVVARRTVVDDTGMIKHPGSKSRRAVAAGTVFRRGYMNRRLADG